MLGRSRPSARYDPAADELPSGEYEPPSTQAALVARDEAHPHDFEGFPVPVSASNVEVGEALGDAFALYFLQLKWFIAVALLMFCCNVPWMAVAKFGDVYTPYNGTVQLYRRGDDSSAWNFDDGTFAALEPLFVNRTDPNVDVAAKRYYLLDVPSLGTYRVDREDLLFSVAGADMLASVIFILSVALLGYKTRKFARELDDLCLEASDYTVYVKGLPEDTMDLEEVRLFFEFKFGKVVDVQLARNDSKLLRVYEQLSRAKVNVAEAQARYLKTRSNEKDVIRQQRRAARLEARVEEIQAKSVYRTIGAFVTFSKNSSKAACVNKCPSNWFTKLMQPSDDKFRGIYSYTVHRAQPPSNVLFENLHIGMYKRGLIELLVNILVVLPILLGSFGILNELTRLKKESVEVNKLHVSQTIIVNATSVPAPPALVAPAPSPTPQAAAPEAAMTTTTTVSNDLEAPTTPDVSSTIRTRHLLANSSDAATRVSLSDGMCNTYMPTCDAAMSDASAGYFVSFSYGVLLTEDSGFVRFSNSPYKPIDAVNTMKECFDSPNHVIAGHRCMALSNCYKCYCYGMRNFTDWSRFGLRSATTAMQVGRHCGEFMARSSASWETYVGSVGVVLLNVVLNVVLDFSSRLERHPSHSAIVISKLSKLYVATLLNSALLALVVDASVPAFSDLFKGVPVLETTLFKGIYPDFNKGWYDDAGSGFVLMVVISTVTSVGGYFVKWLRNASRRWWNAKRACSQERLNELYVGPDFDLTQSFARFALNLTLMLLYGSGMPIIYLAGALCFMLQLYMDRFMVLRVCRKSPRYTAEVGESALGIYPWLVGLHLAVGAWMHSYFFTVPIDKTAGDFGIDTSGFSSGVNSTSVAQSLATVVSKISASADDFGLNATALQEAANSHVNTTAIDASLARLAAWFQSGDETNLHVVDRALQTNSFPLVVLCGLVVLCVPLIKFVIYGVLGPILMNLLCPCFIRRDKEVADSLPTYEDAFMDDKIVGVPGYKIEDNPRYKQAFANVKKGQSSLDDDDVSMIDIEKMLMGLS